MCVDVVPKPFLGRHFPKKNIFDSYTYIEFYRIMRPIVESELLLVPFVCHVQHVPSKESK